MATPTPPTAKQIQDAYALVGAAEKNVLDVIKASGAKFIADLETAVEGLPMDRSSYSPSLQNIASWKGTIQSILSSVESYLSQYPTSNSETPTP